MPKNRRFVLKSILFLFFAAGFSSSQEAYKDRLSLVRDLIDSKELIMIWNQGENQNSHNSFQRIFDLDLTHPDGIDSTLTRKDVYIDSAVSGGRKMAVTAGNFLGEKVNHYAAAWEGPNNTITISVPEIDPVTHSISSANHISLEVPILGGNRKIDIESGDFFGNLQDEIVVAYQGADTALHLQIYSFHAGNLIPQERGNQKVLTSILLNDWDVVTGDFDSDGYDDIALLFVKPLSSINWSISANIYSVDAAGNFILKASGDIFLKPNYNITGVLIDGAAGAFDGDAGLEIALAFAFGQDQENEPDTYLYLLNIANNLNTIEFNPALRIERHEMNESDLEPLDVAAGDLNGSFKDEVVLMIGQTFYVYASDNFPELEFKSQRSVPTEGDEDNSSSFLAVGDMDLDMRSDIVVAKSFYNNEPGGMQHFELNVFSLDSALTAYTVKARRLNDDPIFTDSGLRNYAIALGDFDGDRVRLGTPVHYRKTGVVQPTVVLYTPPTHYDIIDGNIFDLSGCHPGNGCGFTSSYIQSTTVDTTISSEIHEDWGGDLTETASLVLVKAKVKATYGDKFSLKNTSSNSYTITTGRVAQGDDWLYANVFDLDLYEYPVYDSSDTTPSGYFIVTVPSESRPLWIELKDDATIGNQFRPDHETGNLLSYRSANTFDTSRVIVNFPEQTIGATGNSFVSLQIQSFRENQIDTSWDSGVEIGLAIDLSGDFSGFSAGLDVEVNGRYSYGEVYTQTIKVQESMEIKGELGNLASQFGTSGTYYIQPYAYWTSYGALALDFKVSPLPAGGNSFWQANYGSKPDPAFSLPWRYDPEKGYPLPGNDSTYRYRSRDISLSKLDPRAGESVTIYAKIRNYSLQQISSPFKVRFFQGHPNSGGIQIGEASIDTIISARGYTAVSVPWTIPINLPLDGVRVYAVIDPENQIADEIHENNNMGWAPVLGLGSLTDIADEQIFPKDFVLHQSYPNPFNPAAVITFELPVSEKVTLEVFNAIGEKVAELIDEFRDAGKHKVHFHGNGLASGVYFYQLRAGNFIQTKKMILMK